MLWLMLCNSGSGGVLHTGETKPISEPPGIKLQVWVLPASYHLDVLQIFENQHPGCCA
jgi:hypothetical protein